MTSIATNIVDVYVFRRLNARVQFLLLQRRNDVPMARTWQAFHHEIADGQTAPEAAKAAVNTLAGLTIDRYYSADFINQFYDEARDAVVFAPVLAVTIEGPAAIDLGEDFDDAGWFDRDEATARLPFSGQRWAVRHIDEIMGIGESEAELYRFEPNGVATETDAEPGAHATDISDEPDADLGLEPYAEDEPVPTDPIASDTTKRTPDDDSGEE